MNKLNIKSTLFGIFLHIYLHIVPTTNCNQLTHKRAKIIKQKSPDLTSSYLSFNSTIYLWSFYALKY